MRQSLKTAAIFGFTCALAEAGIDSTEPEQIDERKLYRVMNKASITAIQAFRCVGAFSSADYRHIREHIDKFLDETGWGIKSRHAQTKLNFAIQLIERLKDDIKDKPNTIDRVDAVNRLLDAMMAVYLRYSDGLKRQYPLCMVAGLDAADVWNRVMAS